MRCLAVGLLGLFATTIACDRESVTSPSTEAFNLQVSALMAEPEIVTQDLGSFDGPSSAARGVSNSGWVVGQADVLPFGHHAFLWTPEEGMQDLGSLGVGFSIANAISPDGTEIVGVVDRSVRALAFRWTASTGLEALPTLERGFVSGSRALDVNDDGEVVGQSNNEAFAFTPALGIEGLGALTAGEVSEAVGISESGEVAGTSGFLSPASLIEDRAFLWSSSAGMLNLGTLDGTSISRSDAADISAAGLVVGQSDGRNFQWTSMTGMTEHPFNFEINAVNAQGTVAGRLGSNAVVGFTDGTLLTLPMLPGAHDPGEGVTARAMAISDEIDGVFYVAGIGTGPTGDASQPFADRAVRWTVRLLSADPPTPEEMIEELQAEITSLELQRGLETSLSATLRNALKSHGDTPAMINQLEAFINHVEALRGNKLTDDEADRLVSGADGIITELG